MIGGTPQITGEENKAPENNIKEKENSEKNDSKIENDKKEEEKKDDKKEEKPKKKTAFSFIKKKGSTTPSTNNTVSTNNNDKNKSSTNDEDLSKLMKATSSQNSNTFEALNNMSMAPKTDINQEMPQNISDNINKPKDNNKPKGGGFGFIKKGGNTPKSPNINENENIAQLAKITPKIEEKPKPKKKLQNILNLYKFKIQEYHGKMFNYNEDFKNFIRKLTQIRNELNDLDKDVKNEKEKVNNLIKNQNDQIENNNFDMAEKIEEEIKTANNKIEELKVLIRQKNENDLAQIKLNLIQLIKDKNDFYDSYLILFIPLLDNAGESLEEAKQEKIEGLKSIQEEINKVEKDKIENIYKEAVKNFEEIENKINIDFEEEAKDITENINELNNKSKDIQNEIEELKNKIKEKEKELIEINNDIEKKKEEKNIIKLKYEKNEEFQEKKEIMDQKKSEYDQVINNLKSIENVYTINEQKFDKKINEINNIIKTIQSNRKNYPKRIENNIKSSKDLDDMYINNKEKIKKIHTNENNIKELLKKLSENNEKIEVLNMQNKRISSEIASVEANIQNFEDTKKAHVAKKQFKEAQIANNEIKKSKENKAQLDVFLKGNLEEIEILNNDNKETNKSIDDFNEEIKNLEKNIKQKVSYLFKNDKKEGYCSKFAMNSDFESIYFNLIEELKKNINLENTNFYPIGSTTEFLYKNEDDLNIYLDIHKSRQKKNVLHNIYDYLKQKHSASRKINKDNCIFYFKYGKTNVSLIVLGKGPYIHSLLFREYALMDPRFPIVAIALKIFLKELGIKTNNNINSMPKDSYYLNTYSFMSLLVAFLQDIISPPILPKIFSEKKSQLIPKSIPYIPELNEKKFNNFIDSIKYENINIPKIIYEKEELKKIYKEQIENNKNNLSCAEIFLHFLEFLIFYFKFDTLYVNCSLDYEGFDSMNNLINDDDLDTLKDKYPNDISFKEYFKDNYYTKRKDKEEKEINKEKGLYLIRDPVNPFHNPASSLNNYKKNLYQNFFFKLKKGYIKLLKNGNFNCLGKDNK